ncbi:MAG: hypothetical protein U1B94_06905 [candidate division NC10 bacterium]|nr:hypothetical protein [candidate division NC10 bacterium]
MPNPQPGRPDQLDPRDVPQPRPELAEGYSAYQTARKRELTRARIINMRACNRHLSAAQIAGHTGVSTAYVQDLLAHDPIAPP